MPRGALLDKTCARRRAMVGGLANSFDRRFPNIPDRRYSGMLRGALPDKIRRAMMGGLTNSFDQHFPNTSEGRYSGMARGALLDKPCARRRAMVLGAR